MNRDEQIKAELSILLDEYKALKAEVVSNLNSGRQVVNLTLVAVGVLIGGSQVVIQSGHIIVFLIAPLFFHLLAWTQLRYTFLVLEIGSYLRDVLAPRIRQALREMANETEEELSYIMQWEEAGKGPSRGHKGIGWLLFLPIAAGSYGLPLLAAALSTLGFLSIMESSRDLGALAMALIVLNTAALVYSVAWGWIAERRR